MVLYKGKQKKTKDTIYTWSNPSKPLIKFTSGWKTNQTLWADIVTGRIHFFYKQGHATEWNIFKFHCCHQSQYIHKWSFLGMGWDGEGVSDMPNTHGWCRDYRKYRKRGKKCYKSRRLACGYIGPWGGVGAQAHMRRIHLYTGSLEQQSGFDFCVHRLLFSVIR